jgi:organic hydroperoxide reductase OsmC/OhrA
MKNYPLVFTTSAEAEQGINKNWSAKASAFESSIILDIPPEFDGNGKGFSPEDLYAMALQNCFVATFKVFAEKSRLEFQKILVHAELKVDRNEKGAPWMASITLKVKLLGAVQKENAKRILEKTSQSCMILNSVNTSKHFEFDIP